MATVSKQLKEAAAAKRLPPEDRRRHLVAVGLEIFAAKGYTETDLNEIADVANVRRTLLYHYFDGGKEEVYLAVLQHAWEGLAAELAVDPGHAAQLMPRNLQRYLDLVEAKDPRVAVVRGARKLDLPRVADTTRAASGAVARGIAANHLGLDKPATAVVAVLQSYLAFYDGLLDEWTVGRISRDQVEQVMIETLPGVAAAAQRAAQESN